MYHKRIIDKYLEAWAADKARKPLLLRGARQVGKSTAVRHLSESFTNYVEVNFEKRPEFKNVFESNLDVERIVSEIGALFGVKIEIGKTLLFLDEIQMCPKALMSLRFFKEDMRGLHVVAAGSLLEFVLEDLPTFGVGRIHSMYMYPMTFDEFTIAQGETMLLEMRDKATPESPLSEALHAKLAKLFRTYLLVGGMPEVVDMWVETHDYVKCQQLQDDIVVSYNDDFPKYKKKINPDLLRDTLYSVALQATNKFTYSKVAGYRAYEVKKALDLLIKAGLVVAVTRSDANGVPLGSEEDASYRKIMPFDQGLMLRMLNLTDVDVTKITNNILIGDENELVNKGPMAEMVAGLEMLRYDSPNIKRELYYWTHMERNSIAEVDYVGVSKGMVLPIEIKAGVQGGMKSLWMFMHKKHITKGIRCSLENFGLLSRIDQEDADARRDVLICPLYGISQLPRLLE